MHELQGWRAQVDMTREADAQGIAPKRAPWHRLLYCVVESRWPGKQSCLKSSLFQRYVQRFPWNQQVIHSCWKPQDLQAAWARHDASGVGCKVLALLRVRKGRCVTDLLVPTTPEERVAQFLFDWVSGLSFLYVEQEFRPEDSQRDATPLVRYGHGVHASLSCLAHSCAGTIQDAAFSTPNGPRTGLNFLIAWGSSRSPKLLCIVAQFVVGLLIAWGKCSAVPWYLAWRAEARLFPDWRREFKSCRMAARLFPKDSDPMPANLHQVAGQMVEHWPETEAVALRHVGDEDSGEEVLDMWLPVSNSVVQLRGIAVSSVGGPAAEPRRHTHTQSAAMVSHCLLLASLLRDAQVVKKALRLSLNMAFHDLARQWEAILCGAVPGEVLYF